MRCIEYISFKDKAFEKSFRKCLKKAKGKITNDDLVKVNGILISDEEVDGFPVPWCSDSDMYNMIFPNFRYNIKNSQNNEWLSDLMLFSHIKSLHIFVTVDNLSYLSEFKQLKELYVFNTTETDWSFIENLTSLKFLLVNNADFSDLTPLSNLYEKQLALYKSSKRDTTNIFENIFQGLQNLNLENCSIIDIYPLAACTGLDDVNLSHNSISNLAPLSSIDSLYYLTLRYNKITDIAPLKWLTRLYYLNVRHNQINDASVLKSFENSNLSRLFVEHNEIVDFRPLSKLNLVDSDIPRNIK